MGKRGETCVALDLARKRREVRLTVEQLAEGMGCEPEYVWKIESQNVSVTLPKAIKAAYRLGQPLTVKLENVGNAQVVPLHNVIPLSVAPMVPAEAAWVAHEETQEALEHLPLLQRAIMRGDRQTLVHIAKECIVEVRQATDELEAAFNRLDPSIVREAEREARREVAAAKEYRNAESELEVAL